jgi:hypothetical protein
MSTRVQPARGTRAIYDLYIALVILVVAWAGCRLYLPAFRAAGGHAMSYYDEFGPAVMAACGRGLVNPAPHSVPPLDAFLSETTPSFDCGSLGQPEIVPFDNFQAVTKNLLRGAAAIWRVTGVSWTALDSLAAAMFGVTLTAAYLVMRFVMGRPLAVLGTLLWSLSPIHLGNVVHLRDYSKAPFFVLAALAMGAAVRAQKPWMLVALGAVFGVVQAVGFGMRTDVLLNFVPFFLVLFVAGSGGFRINVKWKAVSAIACISLFVIMAWPILTVYNRSEGLWHVSLLGLTAPFDTALNLRRGLYDFGYLYDDSYISAVVQSYWYRTHEGPQVSLHNYMLYTAASKEYYGRLVSTFPADFLTRMAGTALHVLNLPFSIGYGIVPLGVSGRLLPFVEQVRAAGMLLLSGAGPAIVALLLVLIGIRDRIAACLACVVLAIWAAYPYLQLQGRHVFHLEIVTIVLLLWAADLAVRTAMGIVRERSWLTAAKRVALSTATLVVLASLGVAGIGVVRLVQEPRARAVFEEYAKAVNEPVDVQRSAEGAVAHLGVAFFEPPQPRERIQQAMLVVALAPGCAPSETIVHVRYERTRLAEVDFSRDVTLAPPAHGGSTRAFVPVYSIEMADGRMSRFAGLDVPAAVSPCVRLSRARATEKMPLLLDATLPSDWRSQPMYRQLYLGTMVPEPVWLRIARWWPRVSDLG